MPVAAAASTCVIVTPATALTSSRPTSRSGGTYRSNGITTKAPPAPSSPATNAPENPSATRVAPNATVTGARALAQARVIRGEVRELLVGDRLEQGLQRLERVVARVPPVRFEQRHLRPEIAGRLARDVRNALGLIALARGAVADDALDRDRAAALDGGRVGPDRRRPPRLRREVRGDVVEAELEHLLRVRLHLRRRPPARGVVLDGLLEVPGRHAREHGHRVGRALAARPVAGAADERLGGARHVQRTRPGGAREREHEDQRQDGRHRALPFRRPSRARRSRCWSPTRSRAAPTAPTGRG